MRSIAYLGRLFVIPLLVFSSLTLLHCGKPECTYDTDCSGPRFCVENTCQTKTTGVTCRKDGDCGDKEKCVESLCVQVPKGYVPQESTPEEGVDETAGETTTEKPADETVAPDEGGEKEEVIEDGGFEEFPEEVVVEDGTAEQAPLQCERDSDCASLPGTHCRPDVSKSGDLYCLPENTGGAGLGDSCDPAKADPGDCKTNLCRPDLKRCTQVCKNNLDCPAGNQCEKEIEFTLSDGSKKKMSVCFTGGNQCGKDADCSNGKSCSLFQDKAKSKLETRCVTPASGLQDVGYSCSGDSDCKSGYCDSNVCSGFCSVDANCPNGYECKSLEFDEFGQKFTFSMCVLKSTGVPCKSDKDCRRSNFVCAPKLTQGTIELRCQEKSSVGKNEGLPCTKDSECIHKVCLVSTKTCSAPCDGSCSGGLTCKESELEINTVKGKVKICVTEIKSCKKPSDCSSGQVCAAKVDDTGKFQLGCFAEQSSGQALGSSCTKNSDCKGLICTLGRCSQPCDGDVSNCPSGYSCSPQTLSEANQTPITTTLCVVPGTGLSCASDANCPKPSSTEFCRIVEQSNKMVAICQAKGSGKGLINTSCTKDDDCESGTCLQPEQLCTKPCSQDSDCPSSSALLCTKRSFASSNGTKTDIDVCAFKLCKGDVDCKTGQICRYVTSSSNSALSCQLPPTGKAANGSTCQANADCQSQLCHPTQKVCSPPCQGGGSTLCPLQYTCESSASGPSSIHLCLPVANRCQTNSDCPSNQFCTLSYDSSGRPQRTCGAAKGALKLGATCDPSRTDQCQTGVCDDKTRRCSQFCSSACPSPYTCSTTQLKGTYPTDLCRQCRQDSDCSASEICQVNLVSTGGSTSTTTRCVVPPKQSKKKGDACDPSKGFPGDCASHLCDPTNKVCVSTCTADRHCDATEKCVSIGNAGGCVKGTRTECNGDADCLNKEVCQVSLVNGNPVKKCGSGSNKKKGEACDPSKGFPGDCASFLCDSVTQKCVATCTIGLGDCSAGEICGDFLLQGKKVNACIPPPKVCKKQSDCPTGTACSAKVNGRQVDYLCLRADASAKAVGATCASSSECTTGLCHPTLKVCIMTCDVDGDCTNAGRTRCGKMELSTGVLARACIPDSASCTHDALCPSSQPVCGLDLDVQGRVVRKCIVRDATKKAVGASCSDPRIPGDCQNRFCEAGTQKCTATCTDNSHCPQGLVCGNTFVEGGKPIQGCVPATGTSCQRTTGCAEPFVCMASRSAAGINTTCQTKSRSASGLDCDKSKSILNSDCATRVCNPSTERCTDVCSVDADCNEGRCKTLTLEGFPVSACDRSCDKDADCPTGQRCGLFARKNNTVQSNCVRPQSGATNTKKTGDTCDASKSLPGDCENTFCSLTRSKCEATCKVDADCSGGKICLTAFVSSGGGQFADAKGCFDPNVGSCTKAVHCKNSHVCRVEKMGAKVMTNCGVPGGSELADGATCNASQAFPNNCRSRLCDPKSLECTVACEVDGDCPLGSSRTKCGTITVSGKAIKACVQP